MALDAVHDTLLQNMTYEALLADWQKIVCVLGTSVTLLVSVSNAIGIGAVSMLTGPSHTPRHAGPHRAVRVVEVK